MSLKRLNTIKSILQNVGKRQLLLGILGSIRDHYIFVFFFAYFLFSPSLNSFCIVFIGLIFNHLLLNIVYQGRLYLESVKAYDGKIKRHLSDLNDIKINSHLVSDFTDKETYQRISSIPLFKISNHDLNDSIKIYSLRSIENKTILTNVVCFARPYSTSYVFLGQGPEKMNFFGKLKALHEIGHALLSPSILDSRRQGGILVFLAFLFILLYSVELASISNIILLIIGFVFFFRLLHHFYNWFARDLKDEVFADLFGLCFLTAEERIKLSKLSTLHFFVKNDKMLKFHQEIREKILKGNLELGQTEYIGDMIRYTFDKMIPKYYVLRKFVWILFYSSLAYYAHFDSGFVGGLFIATLVALVVFVILSIISHRANLEIINLLSSLIENYLKKSTL